jgi:hypothetical protein
MGFGDILKKVGKDVAGSIIPGAGVAIDVASGLLNKGAADEQGKSLQEANIAQGKLGVEKSEDSRLAHLGLGAGTDLGALGFQDINPAVLEQLGVRRNYDQLIEQGAADPTAGSGQAFLAGLTDQAGAALNEFDIGKDLERQSGIKGGIPEEALADLAGRNQPLVAPDEEF